MEHLCTLALFGMQVQYNPNWRIIPDNAYSLNFDSGLLRFEENVVEKRSRISMGLRWERSQTDSETFLREFSENIQAEYRKAIKGKGRQFELLRDEVVESPCGNQLRIVETQYKATQSLLNAANQMQRLRVCNAALYCESTHRIVVYSLVTTPQYMEKHQAYLEGILLSLQTSPVYPPEEEAAQMQKRRELRAASGRNQSLMGLLKQALGRKNG